MTLSRRSFLQASAALTTTLAAPSILHAKTDTIRIGGLHDLSGAIDSSGVPMDKALRYAVAELNAAGGLLGREVEAVTYDPQSNMSLYSQYATQLALKDKVDVVFGGITSASRETIRPIFHRYKTLYFYNCLYEGGVCDRNEFTLGTTPAQTIAQLVPHVMGLWGKKVYIVAADYNYGHISAAWVKRYVEENGGELVETEFFPLDTTQFGSSISKIQGAKPDIVYSLLVGTAHLGFYRQWAASGMKGEIPIASSSFGGAGTENVMLTPEEGNGMVVATGYFPSVDNAANASFKAGIKTFYGNDAPILGEISEVTYESVKMWAQAVSETGATERMGIIQELEKGKSYDMPAGKVAIDPDTHHTIRDVYIAELKDQEMVIQKTFNAVQPSDTQMVCNLSKDPDSNKQFEISL
ncbi:transporter substrate-binding protein [Pseudooceanicola sp. CBS1P-1]|uniref:Transporter substrate-binding protein n=1 Tax=Pseudooceanicola albus TaxID=2692189 RepID=A0A6L7G706_9RHOB|nr:MULTISPECIES: transporter substrate-binding protein [Pseudooceanicola]MBT9386110.1 transporter substrate-binding protein [Pseudooceanicola endophyticus]MXN19472.1 transporter substrate-binding protein [Pseudooceanicola albus]